MRLDAALHALDGVCLDVVHAFLVRRAAMLLGELREAEHLLSCPTRLPPPRTAAMPPASSAPRRPRSPLEP